MHGPFHGVILLHVLYDWMQMDWCNNIQEAFK